MQRRQGYLPTVFFWLVRVTRIECDVVEQALQGLTIGAGTRLEALDAPRQKVDVGPPSVRVGALGSGVQLSYTFWTKNVPSVSRSAASAEGRTAGFSRRRSGIGQELDMFTSRYSNSLLPKQSTR